MPKQLELPLEERKKQETDRGETCKIIKNVRGRTETQHGVDKPDGGLD